MKIRKDYTKYSIMIVDDNELFREYIKRIIIQNFKSKVVEARHPKEAFEILGKEEPSLIILDLEMPYMDGYTFLQEIRKIDEFKNTPVIISSVLSARELLANLVKIGISDYMVKSIRKEDATKKIANVLNKLD